MTGHARSHHNPQWHKSCGGKLSTEKVRRKQGEVCCRRGKVKLRRKEGMQICPPVYRSSDVEKVKRKDAGVLGGR